MTNKLSKSILPEPNTMSFPEEVADSCLELNLRVKPRPYQQRLINALESGYKRAVWCVHRRAGKDVMALNYMISRMIMEPGVYYYVFPTFKQARRVIWEGMTNESVPFLSFFPEEIVAQRNNTEMMVRFKNGSIFRLVGSDNFDALVGTNVKGYVFSEAALQDPKAFEFMRPILRANKGWALFISTPRGKNHFYDLYEKARLNEEWFCEKLTVEDTGVISLTDIEKDRREGMSEDMIQQEYFCSFDLGIEGSFYGKYIDQLSREGRITNVPYQRHAKVNVYLDIGFADSTALIFAQQCGQEVHIIDCYEASGEALPHYVGIIKSKPYIYGSFYAPHDIEVHEFTSGITRRQAAYNLGIDFQITPDIPLADGIEAGRALFDRLWIDEKNCSHLIKCLSNYRKEYNSKRAAYSNHPLHDWSSHMADAYRYTAVAISSFGLSGMSAMDTVKMREKAYGKPLDFFGS